MGWTLSAALQCKKYKPMRSTKKVRLHSEFLIVAKLEKFTLPAFLVSTRTDMWFQPGGPLVLETLLCLISAH